MEQKSPASQLTNPALTALPRAPPPPQRSPAVSHSPQRRSALPQLAGGRVQRLDVAALAANVIVSPRCYLSRAFQACAISSQRGALASS